VDSEEFRKHAHAFADWMADYLASVERYPVRAQVAPGEVAARLDDGPPSAPEAMEEIFARSSPTSKRPYCPA
jgi:aromatic-L-amino-acid decarboxylase